MDSFAGPRIERLTFAFLLLVADSVAQAPSPAVLHVGDLQVQGRTLKPYNNQWHVSLHKVDGTPLAEKAVWKDELRLLQKAGSEQLERTQTAVFTKDGLKVGETKTVNVCDRNTLAPISRYYSRHASVPGQEEETQVEFHGRQVRFSQNKNGSNSTSTQELLEPVFDFFGGMYGILLAALPLKRGFAGQLPSLDEDGPRLEWITFQVGDQEEVEAGQQSKLRAWVVNAATKQGPMKFWISPAPPYIIKLEYTQNDAGLVWTFSMS